MDRTTNLQAMFAVDHAMQDAPSCTEDYLFALRKAFYVHFIIESVLSERVDRIPTYSLSEVA